MWIDRARAYKILVDGELKGTVRAGETLVLAIDPGRHKIQARLDWTGSAPMLIDVGPGATIEMRVETPANPFTLLWFAWGTRRYLRLTFNG